jgi:hypothetical protein
MIRKGEPMKKFVTFVMILSLGLFCAVGCNKEHPKKDSKDTKPPASDTMKEGEKPATPAATEKPGAPPTEPAAPGPKEPEKK